MMGRKEVLRGQMEIGNMYDKKKGGDSHADNGRNPGMGEVET